MKNLLITNSYRPVSFCGKYLMYLWQMENVMKKINQGLFQQLGHEYII